MGFLSFLFYTIISLYILGFLGRLWLRYWIRKKQREFSQNPSSGQSRTYTYSWGGNPKARDNNKDGEVVVEQISQPHEKPISKEVGEYVGYEEIGEEKTSETV